jgi:hypothetical protein
MNLTELLSPVLEWIGEHELLMWVVVLVAHLIFFVYAAWHLATKYTESTGTPVVVEYKVKPNPDVAEVLSDSNDKARKRRPILG